MQIEKLGNLLHKIERNKEEITSDDLKSLSEIGSFIKKFAELAKKEYGGKHSFRNSEPELAELNLKISRITKKILGNEQKTTKRFSLTEPIDIKKSFRAVIDSRILISKEKNVVGVSEGSPRESWAEAFEKLGRESEGNGPAGQSNLR